MIYATPFLAPIIGAGVGCAVRGVYHGSLTNTKETHDLGPLTKVNDFCESTRFKATSLTGFIVTLLTIEILPFALAAIEEIGKSLALSQTLSSSLLHGGMFFIKVSSLSLMNTVPIMALGIGVLIVSKRLVTRYIYSYHFPIDPSGHVITVCSNAALRSHALKALAQLGFCSYTYVAFTAMMACAETIWVYDTTVNHHSIIDVVSGCALGILSIQAYSSLSRVATTLLVGG